MIGERKTNNEIIVKYPKDWETEYKSTGFVSQWRCDYKNMFKDYPARTGKECGTMQLFAQYALIYLLWKQYSIHSLTWYKIADISPRSKNRERTDRYWTIMKKWMGESHFLRLQKYIINKGFKTIKGEPDLFCWNPKSGEWFFAEAKRKDGLTPYFRRWAEICRTTLGDSADIRVYRLIAEK